MEQRADIKVCYKLGKTATETREILVQVYGREAVSIKCVYEWFKRFREGKETAEDEPSDGDVKPGGPLGTFREEQVMSRHRVSPSPFLLSSSHTTQLQYTNSYTYSHTNLNFLQYTIQILVPHVMWSPQAVHELKIDHTKRHLSALRGNRKHVIVQWVGIRTHTTYLKPFDINYCKNIVIVLIIHYKNYHDFANITKLPIFTIHIGAMESVMIPGKLN